MRILAKNRKAYYQYEILEKYIAGIILNGWEVKSILSGKCSINESYITTKGKEVFLVNSHVNKYNKMDAFSDPNEKRERKLLLNKVEIRKIKRQLEEKGLTAIPLCIIYSKSKKIKVEMATCRGKKQYDKREDLKKKQQMRDMKREM